MKRPSTTLAELMIILVGKIADTEVSGSKIKAYVWSWVSTAYS